MAMAVTTEVRLVKTDLPQEQRRPIQAAVEQLYLRDGKPHSRGANDKRTNAKRRLDFANSLKGSLDESLGAHWHVLVGERIGFACKKRDSTMAIWKISHGGVEPNLLVVMWKSPGIEQDAPVAVEGTEEDEGVESLVKIEEQDPDEKRDRDEPIEGEDVHPSGRGMAAIVEAVRNEVGKPAFAERLEESAQRLRRRLTTEFGTIWHVAVGEEYAFACASDRRHYVVASVGKVRAVCFQHEQFTGGGVKIDWARLYASLPYLLAAFLCIAYVSLNAVCVEGQAPPSPEARGMKPFLQRNVCGMEWEQNLQYVAGAALVCFFFGRSHQKMQGRRQNKPPQFKDGGKEKTS